MTKIFSITEIDGLTEIEFEVAPTYNQITSCIDELAERDLSGYRLWNFSKIDFDLSSEGLRKISSYGLNKKYKNSIKAAFVVTSDLAYGGVRQFEVYRADKTEGVSRVFRSKIKAIEWLRE